MPLKRRSSPQSFAPAPTNSAYVDLLRFEERLKQIAEGLQRTRRRYEAFLYGLILLILILTYKVFLEPSPYLFINYIYLGSLLICIVTLILFFTTGLYNDKIAYAHRYVPSANRSLRPLNIYFNASVQERSRSILSFLLYPFPSLYSAPQSTAPLSSSTTPPISSSPGGGGARSPVRGVALAPIPPSANPRGELIFNSKVSPAFRDGYERFRNNWALRNDPWVRANAQKERTNGGGEEKKGWKDFFRINMGMGFSPSPPPEIDSAPPSRGSSRSPSPVSFASTSPKRTRAHSQRMGRGRSQSGITEAWSEKGGSMEATPLTSPASESIDGGRSRAASLNDIAQAELEKYIKLEED